MLNKHWDSIFADKKDHQLGWYEKDINQTLKFIDTTINFSVSNHTVFLPGAGTSLLVDELIMRGANLVLNDISEEALNKLKIRINKISNDKNKIHWLHHNIAQPLPINIPLCDVWIDRAVLHFLLTEDDINGYFQNLHSFVKSKSYVLLAEFSVDGASKCAGLELHRYSLEEMTERMGIDFKLLNYENYTFINPSGNSRPYIYALFQRQ
nr:methyltransferase type 12 [Cyanobacterium sp. IPPAS B-1200]